MIDSKDVNIDGLVEWAGEALRSSGYRVNLTPDSLLELDRFFDEQSADGKPLPNGLLGEDESFRMLAIGFYVGEVVRGSVGGDWEAPPDGDLWQVEMRLPDGSVVYPVAKTLKRLSNGAEDSLAAYGKALGLPVSKVWRE